MVHCIILKGVDKMKMLYEQPYEKLYGGEGIVYASTRRFGGHWPFKSITHLRVTEQTEVGRHRNKGWELYFSLSRDIRFNHSERWRSFVLVGPGSVRSIQNIGDNEGIVYVIKF